MSKQYLLMVDEEGMARFQAMFRGDVRFLEVNGMDLGGNQAYKVLVCPVVPPVPMAEQIPVAQPQPEEPKPAA